MRREEGVCFGLNFYFSPVAMKVNLPKSGIPRSLNPEVLEFWPILCMKPLWVYWSLFLEKKKKVIFSLAKFLCFYFEMISNYGKVKRIVQPGIFNINISPPLHCHSLFTSICMWEFCCCCFIFNWSVVGIRYDVSFRRTIYTLQNAHHLSPYIHYYWLYFLCSTFYPWDLFIS